MSEKDSEGEKDKKNNEKEQKGIKEGGHTYLVFRDSDGGLEGDGEGVAALEEAKQTRALQGRHLLCYQDVSEVVLKN